MSGRGGRGPGHGSGRVSAKKGMTPPSEQTDRHTRLKTFPPHNLAGKIYVSLQLRMQNAVSPQSCVGKLGISLVLLNFLDCNFRLWFETP